MRPFVDLLHRDHYSLKCALGDTKKILPVLKERNQTHYAVSNYNEISNWVQQLFTCKDNGIVPMLGMEAYVNDYRLILNTPDDMVFKNLNTGKEVSIKDMSDIERDLTTIDYPLTVYAMTVEGYHNIISIHNDSQLNGIWKRPRTSNSFLKSHGKGIVAVLRSPYSEIGSFIYNGQDDLALEKLEEYKDIFDDVYLTVMVAKDESYREVNDKVVSFALKHGIKVIPVTNSHYIRPEDEKAWRVLRKLSTLVAGLHSYEIEALSDMSYHTREEVDDIFHKYIESDIFTNAIYEKFQSELDGLLSRFTVLDIDCSVKLPHFENGSEKLRKYAEEGFVRLGYDKKGNKYQERLDYELDNIIRCEFADYFLIIKEAFDWYRKDMSDVVAVGRGSAAGSLVLNCLGCTDVDPIKNELLFERFLDASRLASIVESGGKISGGDLPDVDSDWATPVHDIVKHHFVDVYGERCTASIGNVGFMKTKSTLKDLARLYDVPVEEINNVTKQIDSEWADDEGNDVTIEKLEKAYPDLKRLLEKYPEMGHVFEDLRGTPTNWGVHAGGVLITDIDLFDQLPLRRSDDGKLVTCWTEGINARELGMMGFIKFDMLAIDQINIIDDTLKLIKENQGKDIKVKDIPLDDYKALSQMNRHDGVCVFQFDTQLAAKVTDNMNGIRRFEDLASLSTLMRPAALKNGFDKEFGLRRDGKSDGYVPDCLKPYLETTYGLPIYQEHIMQIAMVLAGFDKVQSFKLMKGVYKAKIKSKEEQDEWRKKFVKGCRNKIKHKALEVEFENGEKRVYEFDDEIKCIDEQTRKINDIIEGGYEIELEK